MKKFAFMLVACLACVQANAATSNLIESVFEYEAITNAIGDPSFTTIPQSEFIVDIRRKTHDIAVLGIVKYEILTRFASAETLGTFEEDQLACHKHRHSHSHEDTHTYIARLQISPNPGVGPNIVTVLSIQQVRD